MMLSLPASVRIWVATTPTDLRKSFDTLAEVVRQQFQLDPFSGQLFVFTNKPPDRNKFAYWDEDGFVILYKRLEAGTFHLPQADAPRVTLRAADIQMLLDGVDLDSVQRSRRYRRPVPDS